MNDSVSPDVPPAGPVAAGRTRLSSAVDTMERVSNQVVGTAEKLEKRSFAAVLIAVMLAFCAAMGLAIAAAVWIGLQQQRRADDQAVRDRAEIREDARRDRENADRDREKFLTYGTKVIDAMSDGQKVITDNQRVMLMVKDAFDKWTLRDTQTQDLLIKIQKALEALTKKMEPDGATAPAPRPKGWRGEN